jgi:hypothetical protein
MKKFAISLNNLKDHVFYECILQGSKVAVKHKFKDFYGAEETKNWKEDFMSDIHDSRRIEYRGEVLYTHYAAQMICYVFHGGYVYTFDSYFSDCEIFEEILESLHATI